MQNDFLKAIGGDDVEPRFAAWRAAGAQPVSVVRKLIALTASSKPGVAKAAAEALTTIVHDCEKAGPQRRGAVAAALVNAPGPITFRLASLIADESLGAAIAKSLTDVSLREDAIYCLERIPGAAVDRLLIEAYRSAPVEFQPRILAALGHRKIEAGAALCASAMNSQNAEIAQAGARAYGRIGKAAGGVFKDIDDAQLRLADAQAGAGNLSAAIEIYKLYLVRPEEHWRCAALVGLGKIANPAAVAAILPLLKSETAIVRLTARRVWEGIAGGASGSSRAGSPA